MSGGRGPLTGGGLFIGSLEPVVLPLVGPGLVRPHPVGDLQRLLESLEALGGRGERDAEAPGLSLVPAGAYAEVGAPPGEDVQRGHGLQQDARVAVLHPGHQCPELRPLGDARDEAQGGVALEHRLLRSPDDLDLEEVVHHPDAGEAGLIGGPRDPRQARSDGAGRPLPGEARYLQP